MLAMLGGLASFVNSRMDASSTTTSIQSSINPAAIRTNNNKTVGFKSQSPSEDKTTIRLYACETDHMYANYAGEAGKRELADEVSHLKAMVLFHLDLIQQQSESNAAKDKQLSALRHENEMLRQRLERMERRVQLQNAKQKSDSADENGSVVKNAEPLPVNNSTNHVDTKPVVTNVVVNNITVTNQVPERPADSSEPNTASVPPPRKRIKTLLPVRTKPSPSPTSRRKNSNKAVAINDDADNSATSVDLEGSVVSSDPTNKTLCDGGAVTNVSSSGISVLEADGKAAENDISNQNSVAILPEHRLIQQQLAQKPAPREPSYLKKDSILTTEEPYATLCGESLSSQPEGTNNDAQVEVPQWVVKPLSGRSSAQGVENLEDEVFMKRHLKHEIDEKRRKRWDLQRFREQRQYEKLRARYEGEDRSLDRVRSRAPSRNAAQSGNPDPVVAAAVTSLWAGPEDVTHVQVEPWLPVSVFGAPLPYVAQSDFQLPWSNSRSMMELVQARTAATAETTIHHPNKRRQRRSLKAE